MGLDAARKYLAKVVPWDERHHVSIHYKVSTPQGKVVLPGTPFQALGSAMGSLDWRQRNRKDEDIYLSMASQIATETRQGKTGPYQAAKRTRDNAALLKSFFMDIDVKPDKPDDAYPTTSAALAAIAAFLKTIALPKPSVIVSSGTGGFHLYWTLAEPIAVDAWQPWANALAEAGRAAGLKFDSQCTVDPVRLLRVPDTFNAKKGQRLPVRLVSFSERDFFLEQVTGPLAPYLGSNSYQIPTNTKVIATSVNDELSGGITTGKVVPREIERVAEVCPFIKSTLETGGEHNSQPLWFHSLGIAMYCVDGETVAHRLSDKHPGYHPDETAQEYARVKKDHDERPSLGLTSCAAIAKAGAKECASCPHHGTGKRPISLTPIAPGARAAAPTLGTDNMPPGYFRGLHNGFIFARGSDDDGNEISSCIIPYPIENAWLSPKPWFLHFTTSTPGGGKDDVSFPSEAFATLPSASVAFKKEGMSFTVTPQVLDFMTSFIRKLQDSTETVTKAQPFGWYKVDGSVDGFSFNGVRYTPTGEKASVRPEDGFAEIYAPQGVDTYWLDAVRIINRQKRPALDTLIAASFAAPLMTMTGHPGVTVGGWSPESGTGKSTSLILGQAVWGSPTLGILGLDSTQNATFKRAGVTRNLPLMWDEIRTAKQSSDFATMLFSLSGGTEKARQRRDTSLQKQGTWETLMIYASNASMHDTIIEANKTTTAGTVRVFEFQVPPVDVNPITVAEMSALLGRVKINYGWAGVRYAKFLGENEPAIRRGIEARGKTLESKFRSNNDERLWLAAVNALLSGAQYANQLGLTEFDMPGLAAFLFSEFRRMQGNKAEAPNDLSRPDNVISQITNFLAEKRARNTLVTDTMHVGRSRPISGAVNIINVLQSERLDTLQVQMAVKTKIIRFTDVAFSEWLKLKNIPRAAMAHAMETLLHAQRIPNGRLGVGTRLASGAETLWEIAASAGLEDKIAWGE
jgi:hypothetical protein